jgi:hypothetical protein
VTRLVKGPGTEVLEREYVYSEPPISLTELADKYDLARSNVADKARIGKWYEKREEFRTRLAEKSREALAERWVEYETANREKLLNVASKFFDKYVEALASGEIKVNTRDLLGMVAMQRTLLADVSGKPVIDPKLVNPEGDEFTGSADEAREVIEQVKALMAGGTDAGTDPAA